VRQKPEYKGKAKRKMSTGVLNQGLELRYSSQPLLTTFERVRWFVFTKSTDVFADSLFN